MKKVRKQIKQIKSYLGFVCLSWRNHFSKDNILDSSGPVVSLTTYGERFKRVHLAIESIAAGKLKPSRLILWVDSELVDRPTPGLQRLLARGLELKAADNYGPHTKYYPYLLSCSDFVHPLVTADDDEFYPKSWLYELFRAHEEDATVINCHRAHRIELGELGGLKPYSVWTRCEDTNPSFVNFATGVSGVIYPVDFLRQLKATGEEFKDVCGRADDVWLHACSVRFGFRIRQINASRLDTAHVPSTQATGLRQTNVFSGQNDEQIQSTYNEVDLRRIEEDLHGMP